MMSRVDSAGQWEHREDRGELLSCVERADGTLLVEGYAARAGILEYRTPRGLVRELVRADTLQKAARGLARVPVTLEHPDPDRHPKGVTPDNVAELGVGDTDSFIDASHDGGFVSVRLAVRRRDAIKAVRAGKQELSPGYGVRIDHRPGTDPEFGPYDQEQVERAYNHLAIVDRARGGSEIRLRADSGVATTTITNTATGNSPNANSQGRSARGAHVNPGFLPILAMLAITRRLDSDDAALSACEEALRSRNDSASTAETALKGHLAAEKTRADTEKARADAAEASLKALRDTEAARVDAVDRAELDIVAKGLGLEPKLHADSKGLRRAIAEKHLGADLRADASEDYVRALVDLAKAKGGESRGDGREAGRVAIGLGSQASQEGQGVQRHDAAPRKGTSVFARSRARNDSARSVGGEK